MKPVHLPLIAFLFLLCFCNQPHRNKLHPEVSNQSIARGEQLASAYCASCHALPDPSLLNAKSWEEGVLPHMGPRLGIYEHQYRRYPANINDPNLPKGFYPSHAAVTTDEWQHIINYYTATSPDTLPQQQRTNAIKKNLPLFAVESLSVQPASPGTSFVNIDSLKRQLITCDLLQQQVLRYDARLGVIDSLHLFGRIVQMQPIGDSLLACNIGVFNPTDGRYGKGQMIHFDQSGKMQPAPMPLLQNLQRPVQITATDLDRDGQRDYLACEFGYLTGSLSWYTGQNGAWQQHVLRNQPGAIQTRIQDANGDGQPDIWALFAQGDEGVFLFTNKGKNQFEQRQVLRFPPSYGSSSFELVDFNKDGFPDIVYTCGDNADYSTVLKPYHGVYIFQNDGTNHFNQKFFFPINGCYKAMARDFDGDGDLDLACIAFFADYTRQPEEGFVYLENKGNYTFDPFTLPQTVTGRWMTMDAGDLDGDGRIDLVLGNFSVGPVMVKSVIDWEKGPAFLLLRNTGKH